MLRYLLSSSLFLLLLGSVKLSVAQDSIQSLIDSRDLVFVAQRVSPMRGTVRHLTSYYDLRLSGDTLAADLPFFGRAYSAPMHPDDARIRFRTTDFEMKVKRRKNRWQIQFDPQDAQDVNAVFLTVHENGTATLRISSNRRQAISFQGFVKKNDGATSF